MARTLSYAAAVVEAIRLAMAADERVIVIWGPFFGLGPHRDVAEVIRRDFAARVHVPPTAEAGIVGVAIGAALMGARPIVPFSTASFMLRAWDQIAQEAAVARAMSANQVSVPVVFHAMQGVLPGAGAQHALSPQGLLWNTPGLEIALPTTAADAKGLMRSAIASDNPSVVLSHGRLLGRTGRVAEDDYAIPFGRAAIRRPGRDVTLIALSAQIEAALAAAEALSASGIEAEVIDPRTLVPLDRAAIIDSVARTGRLVVVDESPLSCSPASEIAAIVAEAGFAHLKAPIRRIARRDRPLAHAPALEAAVLPDVAQIVAAVRSITPAPRTLS